MRRLPRLLRWTVTVPIESNGLHPPPSGKFWQALSMALVADLTDRRPMRGGPPHPRVRIPGVSRAGGAARPAWSSVHRPCRAIQRDMGFHVAFLSQTPGVSLKCTAPPEYMAIGKASIRPSADQDSGIPARNCRGDGRGRQVDRFQQAVVTVNEAVEDHVPVGPVPARYRESVVGDDPFVGARDTQDRVVAGAENAAIIDPGEQDAPVCPGPAGGRGRAGDAAAVFADRGRAGGLTGCPENWIRPGRRRAGAPALPR